MLRMHLRLVKLIGSVLPVLLLALLNPTARAAENPDSAFDTANKLYFEGKFADAVKAYEGITNSAQGSAALYFNLGNAWFKSGKLGPAIAAFRVAEKLTPRDPDIRANLQFARNQVQGPTLGANRVKQWLSRLTLNEWTMLESAAFWILMLLLAMGQWNSRWKSSLRTPVWLALAATCAFAVCLGTSIFYDRIEKTGIITQTDVTVHTGPFEESAGGFVLHDGAEVRITDSKDDWLQVTVDSRRIGWLRKNSLLLVP